MDTKIVSALFCAVPLFLSLPGQARPLGRPAATLPTPAYGLVHLWLPDTPYQGRSHWRWVLHRLAGDAPAHTEVEAASLDAPPLTAYVGRLPPGRSIELMWQFKKSDLAHQAGLTVLRRLCTRRKIGLHILCLAGV